MSFLFFAGLIPLVTFACGFYVGYQVRREGSDDF